MKEKSFQKPINFFINSISKLVRIITVNSFQKKLNLKMLNLKWHKCKSEPLIIFYLLCTSKKKSACLSCRLRIFFNGENCVDCNFAHSSKFMLTYLPGKKRNSDFFAMLLIDASTRLFIIFMLIKWTVFFRGIGISNHPHIWQNGISILLIISVYLLGNFFLVILLRFLAFLYFTSGLMLDFAA